MKNKSLLIMLLMLIGFSSANAKFFGLGIPAVSSSGSIPYASNWNYSITQQIYSVADVGYSGTVNSIGFFRLNDGGDPDIRNLDVYMVQTDKTQFTGDTDWIPVTSANLVFSGERCCQVDCRPIS